MWRFYALVFFCVLAGCAAGLSHPSVCAVFAAYIAFGAWCEVRHRQYPRVCVALGVLAFVILMSIDVARGVGLQGLWLSLFLNLLWSVLAYRALRHDRRSDRVQVGVLSLIPLVGVSYRLEAVSFLVFLGVYLALVFGFMASQALTPPTTGGEALMMQVARSGGGGERTGRHAATLRALRQGVTACGMGLMALVVGGLLFLVVPRYQNDAVTPMTGETSAGIFPDVELNKTGRLDLDPSLLFRADVPPQEQPRYWRIDAQNVFDGTSWRSMYAARHENENDAGDSSEASQYRVEFVREWRDHRLPTLYGTQRVSALPGAESNERFYANRASVWFRWGWRRGVPLMGFAFDHGASDGARTEFSPADARDDFRWIWPSSRRDSMAWARLSALASEIAGDARSDEEKAVRVRDYMQTHYVYSLERPEREGAIVEDFLFNQKFGHCEMFSTAFAVLVSILGVPVRNVTGFVSSEYRDGMHYVRVAHAHSWAEVYLGERGWVVFDPTPSGPQPVEVDWVVRINDWFAGYQTRDLVRWLTRHGVTLVMVLVAAFLLYAWFAWSLAFVRRRLDAPQHVQAEVWRAFLAACRRREATRALASRSCEEWLGVPACDEITRFAQDVIIKRFSAPDSAECDGHWRRFVANHKSWRALSRVRRALAHVKNPPRNAPAEGGSASGEGSHR